MKRLSLLRAVNLTAFLVCLFLLAAAGYLQLVLGQEPCPLCIIQRVIVFILALLFLIGALHTPFRTGIKISGFFIFLIAALGIGVAGRQVWLQHLPPDQVPPCGPGFNFMLHNFPLTQTIQALLKGSADCAKVTWTFLSMSIAEWTTLFFIAFAITGLWILFKRKWN